VVIRLLEPIYKTRYKIIAIHEIRESSFSFIIEGGEIKSDAIEDDIKKNILYGHYSELPIEYLKHNFSNAYDNLLFKIHAKDNDLKEYIENSLDCTLGDNEVWSKLPLEKYIN